MQDSKKVYLEGHGCSASLADTEILGGLISQGGYELVEDSLEADISVIVTCSVKSVTEQRMLSRIRELSRDGRKVVVAGCLSKAEPDKIETINKRLSMIGPGNLPSLLPAIQSSLKGERFVSIQDSKLIKLGMPRTRKNDVIGIVEISSGCLSSCTFCQVKLLKGTVFSYPEDKILSECVNLISQGSKEIWLTSTDNAAYGRDARTNLATLVKRVSGLPGEFKVRVGMMNPLLTGRILDDLVESFRDEKIFKFLHLPVQSGNDRILKLMQRGYTLEDFYETLQRFRRSFPMITLSTDVIVGFPSETEAEFEDSIDLVKKVKPDVVNISRFGARPGTKAEKMKEQLSPNVMKERSTILTEVVRETAKSRNRQWIGWKGKILVDEIVRDAVVGRNYSYKPCVVKGEIAIEQLGKFIDVEILDATSSTLRATLCETGNCLNLNVAN